VAVPPHEHHRCAERGPAAGLLVFLVSAAPLALVGLVAEAGVVETQAVVAAALGCPRGGRAAAAVRFVAGLVTAGRLEAVRGGGSAGVGVPKRGVLPRAGRGGGGGLLGGLGRPQLVATLYHLQRRVEGLRVDHGADVARQFADEEGDLLILRGGQIVPQHRGPGVTATHRVIQPLVGSLLVSHAVGLQEEILQLLVRVGDGGGVVHKRADGRGQREGKLRHGPVEFCNRLGDVCRGKGNPDSRTNTAGNRRENRVGRWRRRQQRPRPVVAGCQEPYRF
jgi:hypothetical protein